MPLGLHKMLPCDGPQPPEVPERLKPHHAAFNAALKHCSTQRHLTARQLPSALVLKYR